MTFIFRESVLCALWIKVLGEVGRLDRLMRFVRVLQSHGRNLGRIIRTLFSKKICQVWRKGALSKV